MSIELLLQILVFPALGLIFHKLNRIESVQAGHQERFRSHEHRIHQLEKQL